MSHSVRKKEIRAPRIAQQRGMTLLVALLVLVAMSLAGLALVRSVDSATLAAGNLAFRQSAAASADDVMETAIAALRNISDTGNNGTSNGYFASVDWDTATKSAKPVDFTGNGTPGSTGDDFSWSTAMTLSSKDTAGNTGSYVIHRLCQNTGALNADTCTTWQQTSTPINSSGMLTADETYRDPGLTGKGADIRGLYRITVRISGPRNTFNYVQAIVIV